MSYLKTLLLITLAIALFSSCSIEKKRYSFGYHVDWHLNTKKNTNTVNIEPVLTERSKTAKAQLVDTTLLTNSIKSTLIPKDIRILRTKKTQSLSSTSETRKKAIVQVYEDVVKGIKEMPVTPMSVSSSRSKKIEPFSIIALVLGFASWFLTGPYLTGAIVTILILSFISLMKINKNRDQYKGIWLTYLAFGVGIAGLVSLLLF